MNIDLKTGLLHPVRYVPSAYCDDRPENKIIDLIVIHGISLPPGVFGGNMVENFFCGTLDFSAHAYFANLVELRVSAHIFIDRQGAITQFVPFIKRAWHAGKSSFHGREYCNDYSIGIELEGTDDTAYEKIQYIQLARIVELLMTSYPSITRERIVGHSDIAPGRKTDPGPFFDWDYLKQSLKNAL